MKFCILFFQSIFSKVHLMFTRRFAFLWLAVAALAFSAQGSIAAESSTTIQIQGMTCAAVPPRSHANCKLFPEWHRPRLTPQRRWLKSRRNERHPIAQSSLGGCRKSWLQADETRRSERYFHGKAQVVSSSCLVLSQRLFNLHRPRVL